MSETKGRLRRELTAAYEARGLKPNDSDELIAAAIDRLAADVAAVKAKVDAVEPDDVRHFVESEKSWVSMATEQRDAAVRARDAAMLEVTRVKAKLATAILAIRELRAKLEAQQPAAAPQPAANHPKTLDSSPAAPQPAAPPPGWLTEEERCILRNVSEMTWPGWAWYGRVTTTLQAILSRAGSPPVVEVPEMVFGSEGSRSWEMQKRYRAAMDLAGVKWKEVGRE